MGCISRGGGEGSGGAEGGRCQNPCAGEKSRLGEDERHPWVQFERRHEEGNSRGGRMGGRHQPLAVENAWLRCRGEDN